MATTDQIIDECLLGIGEDLDSLDDPQRMTRPRVLYWIDSFYRNAICERIKPLKRYEYDESDDDHTITAGLGSLPSDFLSPSRVYDGDTLLTQITDIDDKVADTAPTSQYMLPDISTLWIFGTTPTGTVTLYYYAKGTALVDDPSSSPMELKEEFHFTAFITLIQKVYEGGKRKYSKSITLENWAQAILDEIEDAHTSGMRDDSPSIMKVAW